MSSIIHFDIAADDPQRAKCFYKSLFGWKIENPYGISDYFLIETENPDGKKGVGGGLGKRGDPSQRITSYFDVASIDESCKKAVAIGGKVVFKVFR